MRQQDLNIMTNTETDTDFRVPASAGTALIRVQDHLGLAHMACSKFRSLCGRGFDYEDLFQAACEGLLAAARTYDPERGAFSTHALPLARRYVKRLAATQARTVKCPEYAQDRAAAAGRAPTTPAAGRARRTTGGPFDWSAPGASANDGGPVWVPFPCQYQGVPSSWAPGRVAGVHSTSDERSLDYSFGGTGGDNEATLHDITADDRVGTPESAAALNEILNGRKNPSFRAALDALSAAERLVLQRRLEGDTLASIGWVMQVSKERVRQIEAGAVERMRTLLALGAEG